MQGLGGLEFSEFTEKHRDVQFWNVGRYALITNLVGEL